MGVSRTTSRPPGLQGAGDTAERALQVGGIVQAGIQDGSGPSRPLQGWVLQVTLSQGEGNLGQVVPLGRAQAPVRVEAGIRPGTW